MTISWRQILPPGGRSADKPPREGSSVSSGGGEVAVKTFTPGSISISRWLPAGRWLELDGLPGSPKCLPGRP
ncbi:tyrosine kinase [Anopheles sinensis]|uniref:Tyrosine kinase n=1 Tax=Anopheles sinensis TaxID=74873 RepID=A0A084WH28_ANOSI|nr:tyrosine kinase [Anopheles sinensis]